MYRYETSGKQPIYGSRVVSSKTTAGISQCLHRSHPETLNMKFGGKYTQQLKQRHLYVLCIG